MGDVRTNRSAAGTGTCNGHSGGATHRGCACEPGCGRPDREEALGLVMSRGGENGNAVWVVLLLLPGEAMVAVDADDTREAWLGLVMSLVGPSYAGINEA